MPTKRGLRKLVDVWGSMEASRPVHDALTLYLTRHHIAYEMSSHEDPYGRFFWRYHVNVKDLCCAQAVLGAVKDIQQRVSWEQQLEACRNPKPRPIRPGVNSAPEFDDSDWSQFK